MQEISNLRQESSALSSTVKPFREPPMLVDLCGPSHAGKTTFAQRLVEVGNNFEIISPDKIRKQLSIGFQDSRYESRVWDIYESMKRKALEKGCNVVLDACHITEKARWHALQGPNQHHRKICVVFDLPLRTVMERCDKEKRVSSKEVRRMWQAFQRSKPSPQELKLQGFDDVCFIKERHVRAMQSDWLGRKAREIQSLRKVFCHKVGRLMSAASSILLWAPPNLCMRVRAAHSSGSVLWQSLAHFGCTEPTVETGVNCQWTTLNYPQKVNAIFLRLKITFLVQYKQPSRVTSITAKLDTLPGGGSP